MPCSPHQAAQFVANGSLELASGFAITPQWAQAINDDDEEFLEDVMLDQAGHQERVVIVAQLAADIVDPEIGAVTVSEPLSLKKVHAFFAKSDATDDEFSWFGPTEGANLLDFLGISA